MFNGYRKIPNWTCGARFAPNPTIFKAILGLLSVISLLNFFSGIAAGTEPEKRVLVLASYNSTDPVAYQWGRGLRSGFKDELSGRIHFDIEHLDLVRLSDEQYIQLTLELLRHKYAEKNPDLLVAIYNGALTFALNAEDELFPEVPIVFAGVEKQFIDNLQLDNNITGTLIANSYSKTLDLALDLHPDTLRVAVISGAGPVGRAWGRSALEAFRPYEDFLELIDLTALPMDVILEKAGALPTRTLIMYIPILLDGAGKRFTATQALEQISRISAKAPVYSFWDVMLGHGIVGGYLTSAEKSGKAAADLAMRILSGKKPEDIPIATENDFQCRFDWRQLQRWSISEYSLPPGGIVEFRPFSFWDANKYYIAACSLFFVFQSSIIFILFRERRKLRREELQVKERLKFEEMISEIAARFAAMDFSDIENDIRLSLKLVSDILGFDRCSVFEFEEDAAWFKIFTFHVKDDMQPPPPRQPSDRLPWLAGRILEQKIVSFRQLSELGDDASLERRYFELYGIASGIVVPMVVCAATIGGCAFLYVNERPFFPEGIEKRLRLIADIYANTLVRLRNHHMAALEKRRYRTVADFTYDWEYWVNADNTLEYISPSCERISGYCPEDFRRTPALFRDLIIDKDRHVWDEFFHNGEGESKPKSIQYRIRRKDGQIRWIEHVGQNVKSDRGESLGYRASNRDVTETKRRELEIEDRLAFEKKIAETSSEFINLPPDRVDRKISDLLDWIGGFADADRSYLIQFNWKKTEFRISHMWEADGIYKDQVVRGLILRDRFRWLFDNLTSGIEVVVLDPEKMPEKEAAAEHEYCRQIGIKSFLMIPIKLQNSPLCAIGLDAIRTRREWSEELKTRLRMVGEIIANAIARVHAEFELRESYDNINRLKERIETESAYLQEEIQLEHNFENIVGQSEELKYVFYQIEQVASTDSSVLVQGETGTGKELVARAIHNLSPRSKRPLIKVNCATLPGELIESELFGRDKGAYTGATESQKGRFEIANGSTLFLDEIGEMPLALQAKLLRVLESGEFERLGNPKTLKSDVRIIAATNRNLAEEVDSGRFRKDLFYRLKVFTITVPPLRRRKADILLLTKWFAEKFSKKMGKPFPEISQHTIRTMQNYRWPGNIRELKNVIEHALITSRDNKLKIQLPDISENPARDDYPENGFKSMEDMERDHILKILKAKDWKIGGADSAASTLKLHPNTLRSRMKKLGIGKHKIQ